MSAPTITVEDAAKEKERVSIPTKVWRYGGRFADAQAAVEYVNLEPAQQAGEVALSTQDDGSVDVFVFY